MLDKLIVQGDVFLTRCKIPTGAKKKKGHILAEGEATGHVHEVMEKERTELYECDGILYLRVSNSIATVKHAEHQPVTIPIGEWKVGIVKEYDPFAEEARNVRD